MEEVRPVLQRLCRGFQASLGASLVGLYAHGSLAFGCFRWEKSDLDLLAVVEGPLTQQQKEALVRFLLQAAAPPKGIEMSVVQAECCRRFCCPPPFELHYSEQHRKSAELDLPLFCRRMHGTDEDLPAHFAVARHCGVALFGPPPSVLFAAVPPQDLLRSLQYDLQDAERACESRPVDTVLNLCRSVAYVRERSLLSKEQGGLWALQALPQRFSPLIAQALAVRRGESACRLDKNDVASFCREVKPLLFL